MTVTWKPQTLINGDIALRLVEPDDAAFILNLRTDSRKNMHLSPTSASLSQQRDWLIHYKEREAAGQEYYFIIELVSEAAVMPIGTVRLYDFNEASFCWGSWILNDDAPFYAAIKSAMLVYQLGFNLLGFKQSHFDVRKQNTRVISFHQKMGATRVAEDENNLYFHYFPSDYSTWLNKFSKYNHMSQQ